MRDLPRQDKLRDLAIKEAAWYLSVSYYWLWRRVGTKDGPPFKKRGRLVILPREEFVAWASGLATTEAILARVATDGPNFSDRADLAAE